MRLGATWIEADDIQQFMQETFETPFYLLRSIEVRYSPITAEVADKRKKRGQPEQCGGSIPLMERNGLVPTGFWRKR